DGRVDVDARGVDGQLGVARFLIRRGDPGELADLAATCLGIQALTVAAFAFGQRRRYVHQDEPGAVAGGHGPGGLARAVERRDRAADRHTAVPRDFGGHPADAVDIGFAVFFAEPQAL